jgi:fibrillarin-like pre-rRNA processing protein
MKELSRGIYKENGKILTENLTPGIKFYGEDIITVAGKEYRVWDPYRSKPAAAIKKGLKHFPIKPGDKILYLGIANGNTASFFSDIIGPDGIIYGVEISERSIRDLLDTAKRRKNIAPILGNARKPETYSWIEKVDIVYQDVATRDQSDIIIRNANAFLKPSGYAIIAIKARSIDVIQKPKKIFTQEIQKLSQQFKIIEKVELDPYEQDHLFTVMQLRNKQA